MFKNFATLVASLGGWMSAPAEGLDIPVLEAAKACFTQAGEMPFSSGPGTLEISRFELRVLLARPITPAAGLTILPMLEYKATALDFNGTSAGFPIGDDQLHSLNLSALAISMREGSPWISGAWARAEMASDFQHVDGDDFTFDLAGGVGYRFNDMFTLGIGGAVMNLNGDATFYPGVGFDWLVSNAVRIGLYGPTLVASYAPDSNWEFSFRGDAGGDVWNITDDTGKSRTIDLRSYRVGFFASRRLTGELWLTAGAGATVGNEIRLTEPDGDKLFKQEMDSGPFGQICLRLKTW